MKEKSLNLKVQKKFRAGRMIFALLAGIFSVLPLAAQPAATSVNNRFLLIFDTSAAMKKRLPAVQAAVNNLLVTSLRGQIRAGDGLGVWTFDRELRTGQFPLVSWDPGSADAIASSLNDFLKAQRYANKTSLDALQPYLNDVVKNSQRLTVLIFCDGESEISWTPYDDAVNQLFGQRSDERKQAKQPFILILRSQLGKYIGGTVGLPPDPTDFPPFPPLPAPEIIPATVALAKVPPPPVVPSLFIIGTNVGTNMPPPRQPASQPALTNVPAMAPTVSNIIATVSTNLPPEIKPAPPTNPAPPEPTHAPIVEIKQLPIPPAPEVSPVTNAPPVPPTNAAVEATAAVTNVVTLPPDKSDAGNRKLLFVGAGLLIVAVALVAFWWLRPGRNDRTSLITRSMNQGPRPPRKN